MTVTSYNGWPASPTLQLRPLVVDGIAFAPGIRDDPDVETVFRYVAEQWATHVEPLVPGTCFGFSYRPNRNDPTELSCHASGTAIDVNSARHPNGVEAARTLTPQMIAAVHAFLASVPGLAELVHWGGDWHAVNHLTPDAMHFELHSYDRALLAAVAARIRSLPNFNQPDSTTDPVQEDDMPAYRDWPQADRDALAADIRTVVHTEVAAQLDDALGGLDDVVITNPGGTGPKRQKLAAILNDIRAGVVALQKRPSK